MEQKKSKSHMLFSLGICVYLISASSLLIYGLINPNYRPYVIGFIITTLLISAWIVSRAKEEPTIKDVQEKGE